MPQGIVPVSRKSNIELAHNARIKTYPNGAQELMVCSQPIWGFAGYESIKARAEEGRGEVEDRAAPSDTARAVRRAKAQLRDTALCTKFAYFVTLTLAPDKVNRYDMAEITRHLNYWLDNNVRRKGLAYVLVPERHKDGAVHFHGFFNAALPAVDSGTVIPPSGGKPRKPRSKAQRTEWLEGGGHTVYNLPAWGWGFSTAIELYGDYERAVSYVCKYIGKDMGGKIGGRWYYSGGDLGAPEISYADIPTDSEDWDYSFLVEEGGLWFGVRRFPPRVVD